MRNYNRLTLQHRYQIQALKETNLSVRATASILKVSPSTISRELKRNKGKYHAEKAESQRFERRRHVHPPLKLVGAIEKEVIELLKLQWSPEQISGRLRREKTKISHESIYQYIFKNAKGGGDLYLNLRRHRKYRRTHESSRRLKNCGIRVNQAWIEERPKVVEKRSRLGDYERDLVLGKNSRILTIVDRRSRLTKIGKLERHTSNDTHFETLRLLQNLPVRTITNDNGPEFGLHDLTAKELKAKIYFARPYCSWQRGTNENTNGLIRQYYPKGTDFSKITNEDIVALEMLLNTRPRKTLGYKTPLEVHTKLSQGVALRN